MSRERIEAAAEGQDRSARLSKEEEERLLDWLETDRCLCLEVSCQDARGFTRIRPEARSLPCREVAAPDDDMAGRGGLEEVALCPATAR